MTISTYSELVTALGDYTDRDDLASRAGTFIQLAEARLNRLLDDPEMEVRTTTTASGDYTALPADYGAMVSISVGEGPLKAASPVQLAGFRSVAGTPRYYSISDGAIAFAPTNATAPITLVYRRRIPALTALNPTNWLLTLAPDVYLYGTLVQAYALDHDEERVALYKSALDEAIPELRQDGEKRKWGAGPIAPRINRP